MRLLIRLCGVASILGGIFLAAFVLIHPWAQLVGAAIARTLQWQLAHTFHFIGAVFTLLGLIGIYVHQRARLGPLGLVGFIMSFIGNAMFVGTGMITAFIWPTLAVSAPATVEYGGPIFASFPSVIAFFLTGVTVILGYVLFGLAMLKARIFPRPATLTLVAGAILGMLPPEPIGALPWAGLVFGGVLYGVGLIWFGIILFRDAPPA
jgi:hypothetical protein